MTVGGSSPTEDAADPLGRLVEVAVFAPLGLAVTIVRGQRVAIEQVGRTVVRAGRVGCAVAAEGVRRVRDEVEQQVRADRERSERARMTGSRGRPRPTSRAQTPAAGARRRGSPLHRPADADEVAPGAGGDVAGDVARRVTDPEPGDDAAPTHDRGDEVSGVLAAADLALPDYDHLPASQIVAMLDDLVTAERDDIERYERANRGRRTVLGKLDQLGHAG